MKESLLFVTFLICALIRVVQMEQFVIGYLSGSQRKSGDEGYSRPGLQISGAISLAVDEINSHQPLVDNHNLTFIVEETFGDESVSIEKTAKLWAEKTISCYIGPQETCIHEARMAAAFNLPMISYFCAHPEASNKVLFPTFSRTRPPDSQISKSVASVLLKFKWRKLTLLYSESKDRDFSAVAKTIQKTLIAHDIEIQHVKTWKETFHYGYVENPFRELVESTYTETRVYVVIGFYFEHLGLMLSLEEKHLLNSGEYFVIGVDIEQYDVDHPYRYFKGLLRDEIEDVAEKAFQSYIGVVPSPPIGFDDFSYKVNKYMQLPPFNFPNPTWEWGGLKRVPAEGAYLYDAVYVYARALNDTLVNKQNTSDGKIIFNYIKDRTYSSAMGYLVHMDENGDAEGNYTLIARKPRPNDANKYGLYPIGVFLMTQNASGIPELNLMDSIDWVDGEPPLDSPICGFYGEKCPEPPWRWAVIFCIVFILIAGIILFIAYRNYLYERELESLLWRVDLRDLIISDYIPVNAKQSKVRNSSQISLTSATDFVEFRFCTVYTQIGLYKGRLVAVKRIPKKSVELTRKMKKELKIIKDLRHDNLNTFIGACVDPPNICILTDYCSRGSLRDVLHNEDVHLDNIFIASMVGDIIRGMIYLHESPIVSHGNLNSFNCLVDSRWTVKITDFGFHELKMHCESDNLNSSSDIEAQCEKLLWRSPELLRDPNAPSCGTQKGDIYSFGILLHELIVRKGPYGNTSMSFVEIIQRIKNQDENDFPPLRPSLPFLSNLSDDSSSEIPDCCLWAMKQCWQENPDERPDFKILRNRLKPLRKGLKNNILDNMLDMMESYTTNLEAIVDERTVQLVQEKKKTESLLYEMLPKAVADSLRKGQSVEAESFECVTVFFSDIVGFTALSSESTPLQVVNFLNDLYTVFDSILDLYEVYKVETIGDSYMVVSGLPIRNGDKHASEIASMALHLLESVKKFQINHVPDRKLLMRVGIHCGPVCAGVVGMKMPRYCLFGDTVNTSSRMESTSEPLRIHCTEEFKMILDKLGGYKWIERGMIPIKGKGDLRTFWLIGESEQRQSRRKKHINETIKNNILNVEYLFPFQQCKTLLTPEIKSKKCKFEKILNQHESMQNNLLSEEKLLQPTYNKRYKRDLPMRNDIKRCFNSPPSSLSSRSRSQTSLLSPTHLVNSNLTNITEINARSLIFNQQENARKYEQSRVFKPFFNARMAYLKRTNSVPSDFNVMQQRDSATVRKYNITKN